MQKNWIIITRIFKYFKCYRCSFSLRHAHLDICYYQKLLLRCTGPTLQSSLRSFSLAIRTPHIEESMYKLRFVITADKANFMLESIGLLIDSDVKLAVF